MTDVVEWYRKKTPSILDKYGPGPRVHFHTGLVDGGDAATGDVGHRLRTSQERLLDVAAAAWDAPSTLSGEVLDVGCGLGGGSIYWAGQHGARVTGITIVPEHVPLVASLAARAGVGDRVRPLLADALAYDREAPFDAAVAIDASCYLPRERWFERLAALVRPGGHVFVSDTFANEPGAAADFDRYWLTGIGNVGEYLRAAARAGFEPVGRVDVTPSSIGFWDLSIAWSVEALAAADDDDRARLTRSIGWQRALREHLISRRLECDLLAWRRRRP